MKKQTQYILGAVALTGALIGNIHAARAQGGSSGMGGGGDYLACPDNGGIKHYLLDTYEEKDKWAIDAGTGETLEERVAHVLNRLAEIDPVRAKRYATEAAPILKAIREIDANREARKKDPKIKELDESGPLLRAIKPLKDIDDADEVYDYAAEGCQKKQIARQEVNSDNNQLQYWLDFNLFDKFDLNQKTATVLHEIIYHELRDLGAITSKRAREFNRLILDPRFKSYPSCTYATKLTNLGFKNYLVLSRVASDSFERKCDAEGNLIEVPSVPYPFRAGEHSPMLLKNVSLRSGRVPVSGYNGSYLAYPKVGEVLKSDHWEIRDGRVDFTEDGTLLFTDVRKEGDTGTIRFVTDGDLRVISLQDTGYFNRALSDAVRQRLDRFVAEIKRLEPALRTDVALRGRVLAVTSWVRREIPSGDVSRIERAIESLFNPALGLPAFDAASDAGAAEWLSRLSNTSITGCTYSTTGLYVAVGFSLRLGVQSLRCIQANGDTRYYKVKPMIVSGMGGGAGLHNLKGAPHSFRETEDGKTEVDVYDYLGTFIVGPVSFGDKWVGDRSPHGWGAGLGAGVGMPIDTKFNARKVVLGTAGLVDALTAKILVDRAQYPERARY